MTEAAATSTSTRPVSSLRVLLRGVIDYAGLFPPASLNMTAAVEEYAKHRDGTDAWMLGRFILPAARLDEFADVASATLPREGARSWALSALLGSDLEEDIQRIERFNDGHRDARQGAVLVDTVELKIHSTRDVTRARELLDRRFDTYMEVPVSDDPAELIDAISETRGKAKIRTGGVTPDAFPGSGHVLRFVTRCMRSNVAFKATAGLHHPWRSEFALTYAHDAPRGTMYGFLNLLLAVAALHAGLDDSGATALLEERDTASVTFDEHAAAWRDHTMPVTVLHKARDTMTAFGSCSFREPTTDLRAMSLL